MNPENQPVISTIEDNSCYKKQTETVALSDFRIKEEPVKEHID